LLHHFDHALTRSAKMFRFVADAAKGAALALARPYLAQFIDEGTLSDPDAFSFSASDGTLSLNEVVRRKE
jgi:hypothetical protein